MIAQLIVDDIGAVVVLGLQGSHGRHREISSCHGAVPDVVFWELKFRSLCPAHRAVDGVALLGSSTHWKAMHMMVVLLVVVVVRCVVPVTGGQRTWFRGRAVQVRNCSHWTASAKSSIASSRVVV